MSTSDSNLELSDGAMILLTTAVFADRERVAYGSSIVPDEVAEGGGRDALNAAVDWLSRQAERAGRIGLSGAGAR